jgi:23S rRNA pseudouridine955/2504/2580 synthase
LKTSQINFKSLILYEDDDFVIVNKPPFLATLAERVDDINLLLLARDYLPEAQVCHRLDKETSGVLAIARNPSAYRHLSMLLEGRAVTKVYHAITDGVHDFKGELVDVALLRQSDGMVRPSQRDGKQAQTFLTTLAPYKYHTLVECRPVTGRTHQIRVHLAMQGAPIAGDTLYGGKPILLSQVKRKYNQKKDAVERPLVQRTALHAYFLEFEGIDGKMVSAQAAYQKDMQAAIRQLERHR